MNTIANQVGVIYGIVVAVARYVRRVTQGTTADLSVAKRDFKDVEGI
jgi:hypothetical protein